MVLLLIAFAVGVLVGMGVSLLRGWRPTRQVQRWRAVPVIPDEPQDWRYMRSGAMPEEWLEWNPELAPRSHYGRIAERVLDGDE